MPGVFEENTLSSEGGLSKSEFIERATRDLGKRRAERIKKEYQEYEAFKIDVIEKTARRCGSRRVKQR